MLLPICLLMLEYALVNHQPHLIYQLGHKELPTTKELEYKKMELVSLNSHDMPLTIAILNKQTLEHPSQHTNSEAYVGEGLPLFSRGRLEG